MSKHIELAERWLKADGHQMPVRLESLPLHMIQRAVEIRESGSLVGILPEESAAIEKAEEESSLRYWDAAGEFT